MADEPLTDIEELVREIAEPPSLTTGLRERIIAESVATVSEDRRKTRRQSAVTACGLSLLLGLTVWTQSLLIPAATEKLSEIVIPSPETNEIRIARTHASPEKLSALMTMSEIGDWGHVEAVTRLREIHQQTLWMFSGF